MNFFQHNVLESLKMNEQPLINKNILITGSARRLGRMFALACAKAGANIIIHHAHSDSDAESLHTEVDTIGRQSWIYRADLSDSAQTQSLIPLINKSVPIHYLVNNAAIFESQTMDTTSLDSWNNHLSINLTAPFILSQAFAKQADDGARIVNILDWRALRPAGDHFPYTISKSALAALTKSMAVTLAPNITVNGLALGAILAPSDGNTNSDIVKNIPVNRWANKNEVEQALLFLLSGPAYITGEIIHVDGGRHLI
jgi:NAD(P)-dependent dehydrogenase (short-subunit alcohol dehydrogenase family)